MRVTVYSEPECQPCEDVMLMLERLAPRYGLRIARVNISSDKLIYEKYEGKVPVVEFEEGRLGRLEAPIDEAQLRLHLEVAHRATLLADNNRLAVATGEGLLDRIAQGTSRRWLRLTSSALALFIGLPWLAPMFAALGWWGIADPIYTAYALT